MATPTLTTPGAGYATDDKLTEAQLIAMGAKGASPDPQTQTMAVALKTPDTTVGGAYGVDANGVPVQFQARTTSNYANAADVAAMNGISIDEAKARIDRARASQSGQIATPEGVFYNPGTDRYSTDVFTVGRNGYGPAAANGHTSKTLAGVYDSGVPNQSGGASPMMVDYGDGRGPVPVSGSSGSTTIGQAYGSGSLEGAYDQYGNIIRESLAPVDPEKIREDTLKRFQAEIDATNQMYNQIKRDRIAAEYLPAQNRLGSDAAVQARRGLIGSDFGGAQTGRVETFNKGITDAIEQNVEAQRIAAIQQLMGKARDQSQKEIEDKTAARTQGAEKYIEFLKGAATRKDERANTAIAGLIAAGSKVDESTFAELAKTLGMDVKELKDKYNIKSKEATAEAAKVKPTTQEVDGVLYERQADGTYKAVTPEKKPEAEKPLIVGGVAYQKQADGSYKPVTPVETPKPLTRQVGKTLYTSLDNGATWAPAKTTGGKTLPVSSGGGGGGGSTTANLKNATAAMNGELSQLVGNDGFVSPDTYMAARNEWIKQKLNPKDFDSAFKAYQNPNNPYYVTDKG